MGRDLSREELHALVWSRPMRTAAGERGIFDVALAKQCRKANVPVPPRGYWNKVHAGKAVAALPLPALPIGARGGSRLDGIFPALKPCTGGHPPPEGLAEPPAFQSLDDIAVRIRAAVGEVKIAGRLANPHPIVAKLLGQDGARHGTASPGSLSYELAGPRFTTPIQQRRLRVLSALLLALERVGCKASGSTHAGERFTVSAGGRHVYILLAVENGRFGDPFYRERGGKRQDGERLRLDVTGHMPDYEPPSQTWRDGGMPLESQVAEMVVGILLHAEREAREFLLWRHKSDIEDRARKEREARLAAERAEAERIAREAVNQLRSGTRVQRPIGTRLC